MERNAQLRNAWFQPPREIRNHTLDSTRWHSFSFREDDIVIATWAKTGTTWLQQIIGQLLFEAAEGIPVFDYSPWIEQRSLPLQSTLEMLASQRHRRFVKTHLPPEALVYSSAARYLYIARDGRDVVWSWYNHHKNLTSLAYAALNEAPGRVGPPLEPPTNDVRQYFHDWLDNDGFPLWPFWSHVQSWWNLRDRTNVMLLHFEDLRANLAGQIRAIARFLDIEIDEELWERILEHCSFRYMKANASRLSARLSLAFNGGAQTFVNRGTSGAWRDVLTVEDIRKYERHLTEHLTPDCAAWLSSKDATGLRSTTVRPE
jgi:aryl sulfotransferase